MGKIEEYRKKLRSLDDWDAYLIQESRLPGPRANLELAFAAAEEGTENQFLRYTNLEPDEAPKNTPKEFLAVCGVIGLGYLAARGGAKHFVILRDKASDPRWRIREAVALGLQRYGQTSIEHLLDLMGEWSEGSPLEKRAVVATLCEPKLLKDPDTGRQVIDILDEITTTLLYEDDRKAGDFLVLRKGLAYGWSVVVATQPEIGKPRMEKWIRSNDPDIRWIMKQNLKKKRLSKMDYSWVQDQLQLLEK